MFFIIKLIVLFKIFDNDADDLPNSLALVLRLIGSANRRHSMARASTEIVLSTWSVFKVSGPEERQPDDAPARL